MVVMARRAAGEDVVDLLDVDFDTLAWPVAERMLQMLASDSLPGGFKPADFVQESFQNTFARRLIRTRADSLKQTRNSGEILGHQGDSVVDAALGVMGFGSSTVCDRRISILVGTLTSLPRANFSCVSYLLSSSSRQGTYGGRKLSQGDEMPKVRSGRMIRATDLLKMVEGCSPFLVSGIANGAQILEVIDAVLRVATDISSFIPLSEAFPTLYTKIIRANEGQTGKCSTWALHSLLKYTWEEKGLIYPKLKPCSRLQFWRLHPLCLKRDLSCLAREAMERRLLPLNRELYEREEWANLVVCFSLAPDVFIEVRRLLHTWFISSGAMRLWELRAAMVAAVCNVLNQPSLWGFAKESYLPPQHAFYCTSLRPLISVLSWSPTLMGLQKLVDLLHDMEGLGQSTVGSSPGGHVPNVPGSVTGKDVLCKLDHSSIGALLMDFLPWLHFASRILLQRQSSEVSSAAEPTIESAATKAEFGGAAFNTEYETGRTFRQTAAKYISWVIHPLDATSRLADEQILLELSNAWEIVQESMVGDCKSGILGIYDVRMLQTAVQATFLRCSICGIPVCKVKKQKPNERVETFVTGIEETVSQPLRESRAALDRWLVYLQVKLNMVNHLDNEESMGGGKRDVRRVVGSRPGSREPQLSNPSLFQIGNVQKVVVQSSLTLAALAESLVFCSYHIVARLLQYVGCDGNRVFNYPNESQRQQYGPPEVPVCNSCCTILHCETCCPLQSSRVRKSEAIQSCVDNVADNPCFGPEDLESYDWVPGAVTIFNFLDSMHDEIFWTITSQSESEIAGAKVMANQNLAVIISEFVNHWGSRFEIQSPIGVSHVSLSNEYHVVVLEDLRNRFCSWIGKLVVSSEVLRICESAQEALEVRITNLRSLLISS